MGPGRIWGKVNWTGSTSFQKGFFKKIAEKGPITLYELSNKSTPKNPPYTSVTRILERWEEEQNPVRQAVKKGWITL